MKLNLKHKNDFLAPVLNVVLVVVPVLIGFVVIVGLINFQFIQKRTNQNLAKANESIEKELTLKKAEQIEKQDQRLRRELAENKIQLIEPQVLVVANTQNLPVIEVQEAVAEKNQEEKKTGQQTSELTNSSNQKSLIIENETPGPIRGIVAN